MCLAMTPNQLKPRANVRRHLEPQTFEGRQGRGGRTHLMSSCDGGGEPAVDGTRLTDVREMM